MTGYRTFASIVTVCWLAAAGVQAEEILRDDVDALSSVIFG